MRWPTAVRVQGPATAGKGMGPGLCGLLALAQLLFFSHAALVGHRICAAHGESVHTAAPRGAAGPASFHAAARSTAAETEGHEHEHCGCMGQGRERFLTSPPGQVGPALPTLFSGRAMAASACSPPAVALWALAPKHSPPA